MLLQILYPQIKFTLGTLYPAYKTWKALKRKDETTRRRWMKYWVSYAAFQAFEFASDYTLVYILPFYLELKLTCIIWLVVGTKLIFDSIVNRELSKREKAIDKWLLKFSKVRNEMVAIMWFEMSRHSVKLITMLMSGGMSVLWTSVSDKKDDAEEGPNSDLSVDEDETEIMEVTEGIAEIEPMMIEEPKRRRTRKKSPLTGLEANDELNTANEMITQLTDESKSPLLKKEIVHYVEPDFNENMVYNHRVYLNRHKKY